MRLTGHKAYQTVNRHRHPQVDMVLQEDEHPLQDTANEKKISSHPLRNRAVSPDKLEADDSAIPGTMPLRPNKTVIRSGLEEQNLSFTHKLNEATTTDEVKAAPVAQEQQPEPQPVIVKHIEQISDSQDKTQAYTQASTSLVKMSLNTPVPKEVKKEETPRKLTKNDLL